MNGRQRARLKLDYGAPFVEFLDVVTELFPRNKHWVTIRYLRSKDLTRRFDLILALETLESEGVIQVDEANPLITYYRLGGGRELKPLEEKFQVFTGFNRSRKLADDEYRV